MRCCPDCTTEWHFSFETGIETKNVTLLTLTFWFQNRFRNQKCHTSELYTTRRNCPMCPKVFWAYLVGMAKNLLSISISENDGDWGDNDGDKHYHHHHGQDDCDDEDLHNRHQHHMMIVTRIMTVTWMRWKSPPKSFSANFITELQVRKQRDELSTKLQKVSSETKHGGEDHNSNLDYILLYLFWVNLCNDLLIIQDL